MLPYKKKIFPNKTQKFCTHLLNLILFLFSCTRNSTVQLVINEFLNTDDLEN
jgi:hypothetical protein